jgi:hypothetical protein
MPKLFISYDAERDVIEDTRGKDGPYSGHCETSTSLSVNCLCRESPETFGTDIEVSPKVYNSEKAYLVVARYSTGDTFSRNRGEYAFIAVFPNSKEAGILKKEIEKHSEEYYDDKHQESSFESAMENPAYGTKLYCPWIGYFDRLEYVEIYSLAVEEVNVK